MTPEQKQKRDEEYLASPDPERIWLAPKCEGLSYEGRSWMEEPKDCEDCDLKAIEYIRIDVAIAGGYKRQ